VPEGHPVPEYPRLDIVKFVGAATARELRLGAAKATETRANKVEARLKIILRGEVEWMDGWVARPHR
jgi:hypothetical protein